MTAPAPHRPRKRFGQHFLHDPAVIRRIIEAIRPGTGHPIIEIGPGHGALTLPLLERAGALEVVEIDRDLARDLQARCAGRGLLTVHTGDILEFDLRGRHRQAACVVGNLPYNISTPCLFHLLNQLDCIREMVLMMQKEVVDRICAAPGTRAYGRLGVMVQARCAAEKLFTVGPGAFRPPPRVESGVVRLTPLEPRQVRIGEAEVFRDLVRRAFTRRRKTLRNALRDVADGELLDRLSIAPGARPGDLSVTDYINLANALMKQQNQ